MKEHIAKTSECQKISKHHISKPESTKGNVHCARIPVCAARLALQQTIPKVSHPNLSKTINLNKQINKNNNNNNHDQRIFPSNSHHTSRHWHTDEKDLTFLCNTKTDGHTHYDKHIHAHTDTQKQINTQTLTNMHTHTHTHTNTHTHTLPQTYTNQLTFRG